MDCVTGGLKKVEMKHELITIESNNDLNFIIDDSEDDEYIRSNKPNDCIIASKLQSTKCRE